MGGYFDLNDLVQINKTLLSKGFVLNYDIKRKYVNIFQISKKLCDRRNWKSVTLSVVLVKRFYPNILPGARGYSGLWDNFVVVIEDFYPFTAEAMLKEGHSKRPENAYISTRHEKLWQAIGKSMTIDKANQILYRLSDKDFRTMSLKETANALITQTAIHETKHKIDEWEDPNQKLSLDHEASAHLASAIFSPCPFDGLRSAIQRMESFYENTRSHQIGKLLYKLWSLADIALTQNYSKEKLREELRKIYSSYRTVQRGEPLIPLDEFQILALELGGET
jgi:hypothetical protein